MVHLSKPIKCTTQSEPQCRLWTRVGNEVSVLVHGLERRYCLDVQDGDGSGAPGGGGEGELWNFSLNFVLNLKYL